MRRRSGLGWRALHGYGELEELRAAWSALCDRCDATPFQRPEWLMPWIRHFGPTEPWLMVRGNARSLHGFAPLFRFPWYGRHHLAILGAGISDYLDVLLEDLPDDGVPELVRALWARAPEWEVCDLEELRPTSRLVAALGRRGAGVAEHDARAVLALPDQVGALAGAVPYRHFQSFAEQRHRARRLGDLELIAADREWPEMLELLFHLHGPEWRGRADAGMKALRSFHREVAGKFHARGALGLYGLRIHRRIVAVVYGFIEGLTFYLYHCGIDPTFRRISPGTVLLGMVLEDCIRRGLDSIDFLRGHKHFAHWWGASQRSVYRIRLSSKVKLPADDPARGWPAYAG